MNWQETLHEAAFTAENFMFADGGQLDLRLALPDGRRSGFGQGNAVLLLHGTVGNGQQFLQPRLRRRLFDPGEPLDARKHFIILPDAIGHGKSSKPSDGLEQDFPATATATSWRRNHRLVTEGLGLSRLRLVMGMSMGGMQTWMWGERHPDMMDALMPVASHLSVSPDATCFGAGCCCGLSRSTSQHRRRRRRAAWGWPGSCSR